MVVLRKPPRYKKIGHVGSDDALWMDDGDAGIASEVIPVEREQVRDAMSQHRCCQSSVVHPDANNPMRGHRPAPLLIDLWSIGKKRYRAFNSLELRFRLGGGHSETVSFTRSGSYRPELDQVLSNDEH